MNLFQLYLHSLWCFHMVDSFCKRFLPLPTCVSDVATGEPPYFFSQCACNSKAVSCAAYFKLSHRFFFIFSLFQLNALLLDFVMRETRSRMSWKATLKIGSLFEVEWTLLPHLNFSQYKNCHNQTFINTPSKVVGEDRKHKKGTIFPILKPFCLT